MKKTASFLLLFILFSLQLTAAFAEKNTGTVNFTEENFMTESISSGVKDASSFSETAAVYDDILESDETAAEYLCGYWTDGCSNYIYAEQGSGILLNWLTNLPYPDCTVYMLENGVFRGKTVNEKSEIVSYDIFSIEIIDEDSIKVYSFYTEEETVFERDSFTYDAGNLNDDYVFRTMARAESFLEGEWMTADLDWFVVSSDENGAMQLNTDLACPDMDFDTIDCCGGSRSRCAVAGSTNCAVLR